ncbi:hypothetical protein HMPREF1324_1792 [Rothia aeria F0474]|uniref:Uncharacterized protein n=1 Tax=Rothia aeria F0474 TaxID=1125724 RepID=I0UWF5_9MICC|nr:hypothetical protein HMPREF1324_1792 [Rothia aeria F0474]
MGTHAASTKRRNTAYPQTPRTREPRLRTTAPAAPLKT